MESGGYCHITIVQKVKFIDYRSAKRYRIKCHWAAHKHTAAEIAFDRLDSGKENMELMFRTSRQ